MTDWLWLTNSLLFSTLDWCDPGVWRCQLKTYWGITVANVDDEDCVGNSLMQIWKLRFGHKAKLLFRLSAQGLVRSLKLKFRRDFEAEVWSVFCCWCLVEVTKLNLCEDYEASFGQDFKFKFSWDALSRFQNWSLIKICVELVIWTHPSGPLCLWQCLRIIFEPSRLPPVTLLTPFWKSHWVFVA